MHAVVEGGFFKRVVHLLGSAAIAHRVEEPHFDVGVRIQRLIGAVTARVINIIKQYAHPHAAIGGLQYLIGEPKTAVVALPEVVLNIESGGG